MLAQYQYIIKTIKSSTRFEIPFQTTISIKDIIIFEIPFRYCSLYGDSWIAWYIIDDMLSYFLQKRKFSLQGLVALLTTKEYWSILPLPPLALAYAILAMASLLVLKSTYQNFWPSSRFHIDYNMSKEWCCRMSKKNSVHRKPNSYC